MKEAQMEQKRQEILDTAFNLAKKYEMEFGDCAQCVFAGVTEAIGMENIEVFRAATGFADGIGLTGDGHCGALSGGVMSISYVFGRDRADFHRRGKMLKALSLSRELQRRFRDKYGTCRCHDLQTKFYGKFYDMMNPAEMEAAVKAGMLETCSTLTGEVARMAAGLILEQQEKDAAKSA
jgi:C_GCAxxG_C_C family probable redox protein